MPTIAIRKTASTRTAPKRKPAPKSTPKRSPAAKSVPKRKPAAKAAPKPAASAATAATNGARVPEGWTQRDFNQARKDMARARNAREKAENDLKEAQKAANALAVEMLDNGVQMSVVSTDLVLSRQWLYTMLDKREEEQGIPSPVNRRSAKPAAKKRAAKKAPAAAKRSPARKTPAKKAPARKRPAGGRVIRRAA